MRTADTQDEHQMALLPNAYHPGPRCSCRHCLTRHPSTEEAADMLRSGCEELTSMVNRGEYAAAVGFAEQRMRRVLAMLERPA